MPLPGGRESHTLAGAGNVLTWKRFSIYIGVVQSRDAINSGLAMMFIRSTWKSLLLPREYRHQYVLPDFGNVDSCFFGDHIVRNQIILLFRELFRTW